MGYGGVDEVTLGYDEQGTIPVSSSVPGCWWHLAGERGTGATGAGFKVTSANAALPYMHPIFTQLDTANLGLRFSTL